MVATLRRLPIPVLDEADRLRSDTGGGKGGSVDPQPRSPTTYVEWADRSDLDGCRHWLHSVPATGVPLDQLHLPRCGVEVRWRRGHPPVIAGPSVGYDVETVDPGDDVVGIRLPPGRWPDLPTCTIQDLTGTAAPLGEILTEELAADDSSPAEDRHRALRLAVRPLLRGRPATALPLDLVHSVVAHDRPARLVANTTGWSERQTRRRVREATGLTIRELRKLGRFQRFVNLAQLDVVCGRGRAAAHLAAAAGYADQSHLHRACRAMAGLTPAEYLERTRHGCVGHHHLPELEPTAGP